MTACSDGQVRSETPRRFQLIVNHVSDCPLNATLSGLRPSLTSRCRCHGRSATLLISDDGRVDVVSRRRHFHIFAVDLVALVRGRCVCVIGWLSKQTSHFILLTDCRSTSSRDFWRQYISLVTFSQKFDRIRKQDWAV